MCGIMRHLCDVSNVYGMAGCMWYVAIFGGCLESIQD